MTYHDPEELGRITEESRKEISRRNINLLVAETIAFFKKNARQAALEGRRSIVLNFRDNKNLKKIDLTGEEAEKVVDILKTKPELKGFRVEFGHLVVNWITISW